MIAHDIESALIGKADVSQAQHLMRFFKTGPGEYGEGDRFLGIRVPVTRAVVKEYRDKIELADIDELLGSPWHEIRLCGFLLLIELYKKVSKLHDESAQRGLVQYYLSNLERGNNWDLVDLVAPKILGDFLCSHPEQEDILDKLANMDGHLWHQRVAIVATLTLICAGSFDSTLRISEKMLNHKHDLIHKATGWMLREMGKRGGMPLLVTFLDNHAHCMPRTMLRYAIEKLPLAQRHHYMQRF